MGLPDRLHAATDAKPAMHEAIWIALNKLPDPAQPEPAIDILVTDFATAE